MPPATRFVAELDFGRQAPYSWVAAPHPQTLPQGRPRRVKRVLKGLLSSSPPPLEDSARGVFLINRDRVCDAINPPGFRKEPGPAVTLISGACAAGKSAVSRLAFMGEKGVMYVELPAGGEDIESLWLTKVYAACGVQAQAGEDLSESLVLQTALLQLKRAREQRQHKHAQLLPGAERAVGDDPSDMMPVFVTDLTSRTGLDQLYQLLLLFKRLGPDSSLARFVVVVSAAHTAAGVATPLARLRVQVIEVGDLEEDEGRSYVGKALHSWLSLRPNVSLTPDEKTDIITYTVAKCGTLVGRLKQICQTGWGRCSSVEELKSTVNYYVAKELLLADGGLRSLLSSLSADGASATQLSRFLRLFVLPKAEMSARASSSTAQAAIPTVGQEGMMVADAVSAAPSLKAAANVLGVAPERVLSGNLGTGRYAHPLLTSTETEEVRAASIFVETSMREHILILERSVDGLQEGIHAL